MHTVIQDIRLFIGPEEDIILGSASCLFKVLFLQQRTEAIQLLKTKAEKDKADKAAQITQAFAFNPEPFFAPDQINFAEAANFWQAGQAIAPGDSPELAPTYPESPSPTESFSPQVRYEGNCVTQNGVIIGYSSDCDFDRF